MFGAIVKGIFSLVLKLFDLLFAPIITGITVLFPAVGTFFGFINTFLDYSLTYVGLTIDLLFIPRGTLIMLFDYYIITYSIFLLSLGIRFAITIYNKLKI